MVTNNCRNRGYVEMLEVNEQDLGEFVHMKIVNGESKHTTEYYERYIREFDAFSKSPFVKQVKKA